MDVKVKLLESPDGRNHLIIIVSGLIDAEGLEQIFRQVAEIIQHHFNCKILIDFEKANLRIDPKDIDELVHGLGPDLRLGNIKIALVSPAEIGEAEQVKVLSESLCREDLTSGGVRQRKGSRRLASKPGVVVQRHTGASGSLTQLFSSDYDNALRAAGSHTECSSARHDRQG